MERKPGKRRLTWIGNNRPGASKAPSTPAAPNSSDTPDALRRRDSRGSGTTDSWLVQEPKAPSESSPRQVEWKSLPKLPSWPPLPQYSQFAAKSPADEKYGVRHRNRYDIRRDETYNREHGESYTDEHAVPTPDQGDSRLDGPEGGRLRGLWRQTELIIGLVRRPRVALLIAVAGAIVLFAVFGVAALSSAFFHGETNSMKGASGIGSAQGAEVSPSAGQSTPRAARTTIASPVNTQPPAPLTMTFTCASGAAGGTGQLCVHTLPNAALSLTVRYCDGTYAKGKAFHGFTYADGSGNYTWRWSVTTTCVGAATATVTATSAGQTVTQHTTFTVTA